MALDADAAVDRAESGYQVWRIRALDVHDISCPNELASTRGQRVGK